MKYDNKFSTLRRDRSRLDILAFLLIAVVVAFYYASMPKNGVIWWSDASRNALNGAFVLDFVKAMPIHRPVEYAYDYYRQWPALTILFYPPLYYVALAATYAVFGVSEASALLAASLFLLALGWGAYRLSCRWLGEIASLAVAVLTIGTPEMAYWGRQVMLDVPSYAFLVWSAVFLFRHLDARSQRALYAAVLFLVLAIYTKYNSAFFAAAILAAILAERGWRAVLDRKLWQAALFGAVLMIPLVAIFLAFGRYNLEQAASVPTAISPRWSIAGWTYYASVLPGSVTWPVISLFLLFAAGQFWSRFRLPLVDLVFFGAWLAAGYAFYSLVAVKEPRYDLFAVYPIVLGAVLAIDRALSQLAWRSVIPLVLAAGTLVWSQVEKPAPYVTGMREAADAVAKAAAQDSNVAFWGKWDGSFIFDLRAYGGRPDLGVLRLDKLLLSDVVVSFNLGMKDKGLTADQIVEAFRAYHIQYVVFHAGFRTDIDSVKTMQALLDTDRFERMSDVEMRADYPFQYITDLVIYRFREPPAPGRVLPPVEVKLLGKSLN
jgi:hypothetical protein